MFMWMKDFFFEIAGFFWENFENYEGIFIKKINIHS